MSDAFAGPESMVFVFLSVGAIALFSMISIATWSEARRKEREAYYKNDMLKKLAESQGPGVNSAIELMREEDRISSARKQQGLRISGLILCATGLGVMIFLHAMVREEPVYLTGMLVLLIGLALYGSSYLVKAAS
jgi:hypothetical protein